MANLWTDNNKRGINNGRIKTFDFKGVSKMGRGPKFAVDVENFSAKISHEREKRGMTLVQLSEATGVHFSALSRVERGLCQPSQLSFFKLCAYFGLDGLEFQDVEEQAPAYQIRMARMQQGLEVDELAKMVGVKSDTIYRYERGPARVDSLVFAKICKALGLDLLDYREEMPEGFALIINRARERADLTLSEVAELTGIHISSLYRYEKEGVRPRDKALKALCALYNIPYGDLAHFSASRRKPTRD